MTPRPRTPQLRDKRFARVRRITQSVLIGSGVASGLFVGYAASTAKPLVPVPTTTPSAARSSSTTSVPSTTLPKSSESDDATSSSSSTRAATSQSTSAPAPAPTTPTTTCYTTPSGTQVCY